jgi:hypothetical protein
MCCPADGKGLDVEGGFLEPGGVVGDEGERPETDLVAQGQTTAGNHDDDEDCNLAGSRLDAGPTVGANCRGNESDNKKRGYGGGGSVLATTRLYAQFYEFRPLSEEVIALRLGAAEAC